MSENPHGIYPGKLFVVNADDIRLFVDRSISGKRNHQDSSIWMNKGDIVMVFCYNEAGPARLYSEVEFLHLRTNLVGKWFGTGLLGLLYFDPLDTE